MQEKINYLNAVFWDYPKLRNEKQLKNFIENNRNNDTFYWILSRFLKNARAIDTLKYFNINEIENNLKKLKLDDYTKKKWERLIQVYGN